MLRVDERIAWNGFRAAAPLFAGEALASEGDGPDPPDVLCLGASGARVGVELTKWVEHDQVTRGKRREFFENRFLKIIHSEQEPPPAHIGWVVLKARLDRIEPEDEAQFRHELFSFLADPSATPESLQGRPVEDFTGFPVLQRYLHQLLVFPRKKTWSSVPNGFRWIIFEPKGGAYTPDWMVQAAIGRILAKIKKHEHDTTRKKHALSQFDLVCYYCDEALLHNTPIEGIGFGFRQLAAKVAQRLAREPRAFDRIFLFNPYEKQPVAQVYPAASAVVA